MLINIRVPKGRKRDPVGARRRRRFGPSTKSSVRNWVPLGYLTAGREKGTIPHSAIRKLG